jgi:transcriptional regulator with XRE-family HTH domain
MFFLNGLYNASIMSRESIKSRASQGAHLAALRKAAGLTQEELAGLLGEPQSNITFWEHSEKPPRSEVLPKMAKALNVTVEELILTAQSDGLAPRKNSAPSGKARRVFEEVSRLPRHQQQRILGLVEDLLAAHQLQREQRGLQP